MIKYLVAAAITAAALLQPPTAGWPTNGGNLYNQRWSPLTAINRDNVAQLKGVWRARLRGSGTQPQYSGFATPLVDNGVAYVSTGANDVFAVSIDSGDILWQWSSNVDPGITSVCCGWNNKGLALSDDRVFQSAAVSTRAAYWSIPVPRTTSGRGAAAAPPPPSPLSSSEMTPPSVLGPASSVDSPRTTVTRRMPVVGTSDGSLRWSQPRVSGSPSRSTAA